ncbi:hypothetical protein ACOME3_010287 [Neoechinorhynchus agilis]
MYCKCLDVKAIDKEEIKGIIGNIHENSSVENEFVLYVLKSGIGNDGGTASRDTIERLHDLFAEIFETYDDGIGACLYHYIRGTKAEECAKFLIKVHEKSQKPNECELVITQAVFQALCLPGKLDFATRCLHTYKQKHPQLNDNTMTDNTILFNY